MSSTPYGRNGNGAATMPPSVDLVTLAPAAPAFTEAPASVNTRVSWRGHDVQLTLRGESGAAVLQRLDVALGWLAEHGATPVTGRPPAAATEAQAGPSCPVHGSPMRQGKRGWFCPRQLSPDGGDGRPVYCRAKVDGEGGRP